MTTVNSSRNVFTVTLLWITVILLLLTPLFPNTNEESLTLEIIGIVIIYAICGFIIWILLDTKYKINNNDLYYYCGPFRGKIDVNSICKIENWNKWYVASSMKPTLDKDGLIIYYEKFNDIYISPKNKEEFINTLQQINPNIEVI